MKHSSHLKPMPLGLALGVFWGVVILLVGFLALYTEHGKALVLNLTSFFHLGATSTVSGVLLAGLMAFIDAFVIGFIIAHLYNLFSCCFTKSSCCSLNSSDCVCPCCKKDKKASSVV